MPDPGTTTVPLYDLEQVIGVDLVDVTEELGWAAAVAGDGAGYAIGVAGASSAEMDLSGGPEAWLVGALLLLLVFALSWVLRFLGWALSWIPILGPSIQSSMNAGANWLQSALWWSTIAPLEGIWHFFQAIYYIVWALPHALVDAAVHMVQYEWTTRNVSVPQGVTSAWNHANQLYNASIAYSWLLYRDATNYAAQLWTSAWNHANDLYNAATSYTYRTLQWEEQQRQGGENALHQEIIQTHEQIEVDLQRQVQNAESQAQQQLNGAETRIEQQREVDLHNINSYIGAVATAGAVALHGAVSGLNTEIGALGTQTQTETQGLQQQINTMKKTCVDPMCQTFGNDANQLLNLLSLGGLVAIFAFIAECIHDPVPTADLSVTLLDPIIGTAGGMLDELVSVIV